MKINFHRHQLPVVTALNTPLDIERWRLVRRCQEVYKFTKRSFIGKEICKPIKDFFKRFPGMFMFHEIFSGMNIPLFSKIAL